MLEKIENAKIGSIVPLFEVVESIDPTEFFIKLSNYGRNKNALLFESADGTSGERSLGSANPCLKVSGKDEDFEIKALNNLGRKFLQFLKGDFKFCDKVEYGKNAIKGKLKPLKKNVSEDQRLKLKTHIDILRTIAFKFKPTEKPFISYAGLFGIISYDFIDYVEDLPKNAQDNLNDADYEMYFLDNLFVIDHKENRAYIVANALVMDNNKKKLYNECLKTFEYYKKSLKKKIPQVKKFKKKALQLTTDTTKEEFISIINKIKRHILDGDILQGSVSRTIMTNYNSEPLDIYNNLKQHFPGSYMFYINGESGILLGSSPYGSLKVEGDEPRIVEIKLVGEEMPRGLADGNVDKDLDSKYEAKMKIDSGKIAQHTMFIDLYRSSIARIAEKGSRYADELYAIEKHPDKQYLVSNVKGTLREDLDALHAYLTTMNLQAGVPGITAIKLLRQYEKTRRGFYGGSVCYMTPSGDFNSAIITRAMKLKNNKAYVKVGANVVHNSIPENKFQETEKKAKVCINRIKTTGGLK